MDTSNRRIEWIDIAKGIGILLVILGHTIALKYSKVLYTFHMPLFFLLSGLVAKECCSFKDVLINKTKRVLKPWVTILLLSFVVVMLIPEWRIQLVLGDVLKELYSVNTNLLQNSLLWYLVCFFFVSLLFYPLSKFVKMPLSSKRIVIFAVISYALLYLKDLISIFPLPEHRLPFKIDTACVGLVFFAVGFYTKQTIIQLVDNARLKWIIILLVVCLVMSYLNGWTNLNSYDFGNIKLLFYPIAFIGITVCLFASVVIEKSRFAMIKNILVFYGKNSLLIFGFQSLLIRLYLLLFNHVEGLNMQLYADNPIIHQIGSFFIVSFIGSPFVVATFRFLRKRGINIL